MRHFNSWVAAAIAALGSGVAAPPASATEGYFQTGYGAVQKSLVGAGSANPEDATALALNPAGLVDVGRQFNAAITLFAPSREYTATGTGFIAPGSVTSDHKLFPIPTLAYSQPLDGESAFGVAAYGNGGLDTSYNIFNVNTRSNGVFGAGVTGVDLTQAFLAVGYARRFGDVALGVSPIIAVQRFNAWGLAAFAPLSADPRHLTNQGYAWSYGAGVRGGLQWSAAPGLRFAFAASTPIFNTNFHAYRGLFADYGNFNAPANVTAGVAFDASDKVTLVLDYKRIFYSLVGSVGNSSSIPSRLGLNGGPGFAWKDVDIVALGAEWRATPDLTLRIGYAHNTNPVRSSDIVFNILAPGVVTDHIGGGFSYKLAPNSSIDFAAIGVPRRSLSGPVPPAFGGGAVEFSMAQFEATIGWSYRFETGAAPIVAKY